MARFWKPSLPGHCLNKAALWYAPRAVIHYAEQQTLKCYTQVLRRRHQRRLRHPRRSPPFALPRQIRTTKSATQRVDRSLCPGRMYMHRLCPASSSATRRSDQCRCDLEQRARGSLVKRRGKHRDHLLLPSDPSRVPRPALAQIKELLQQWTNFARSPFTVRQRRLVQSPLHKQWAH